MAWLRGVRDSSAADDSARETIGLIHPSPQTDPDVDQDLPWKVRELDEIDIAGTDNEQGDGDSFTAARLIQPIRELFNPLRLARSRSHCVCQGVS
jgi:hypothetical protein